MPPPMHLYHRQVVACSRFVSFQLDSHPIMFPSLAYNFFSNMPFTSARSYLPFPSLPDLSFLDLSLIICWEHPCSILEPVWYVIAPCCLLLRQAVVFRSFRYLIPSHFAMPRLTCFLPSSPFPLLIFFAHFHCRPLHHVFAYRTIPSSHQAESQLQSRRLVVWFTTICVPLFFQLFILPSSFNILRLASLSSPAYQALASIRTS